LNPISADPRRPRDRHFRHSSEEHCAPLISQLTDFGKQLEDAHRRLVALSDQVAGEVLLDSA